MSSALLLDLRAEKETFFTPWSRTFQALEHAVVVFTHDENDNATFRMITSQFRVSGHERYHPGLLA
jgi:hypothetical protein